MMTFKEFWNLMRNNGQSEKPQPKSLPPIDPKDLVRKHIFFSGEVQGVGFRYRCKNHADELHVTGKCRNLHDGRVEGEFQADEAHINELIRCLKQEAWITITSVDMTDIPVVPNETEFSIDYY